MVENISSERFFLLRTPSIEPAISSTGPQTWDEARHAARENGEERFPHSFHFSPLVLIAPLKT